MLRWLQASLPQRNPATLPSASCAQHGTLLLNNSPVPEGRFSSTSLHHRERSAHVAEAQTNHLGKRTEIASSKKAHVGKHSENIESQGNGNFTQLLSESELQASAFDQLHRPPLCHADFVLLANLLRSCSNSRALLQGRFLHIHIIKCELDSITFLQNLLLQMYGKCGVLDDAHALFAKMHEHDQYSWNFMASAYTQNAEWNSAFELHNQLRIEGIIADEYVLSSVLSAFAGSETLRPGKCIHACIVGSEFELVEAVSNGLINLYGKCGCPSDAWTVFSKMVERSVISWSSIITVYTQYNRGEEAIWLWSCMQQEAIAPNKATLVGVLDACANEAEVCKGKQFHCCLLGSPLESDGMVLTTLVNMYGKCSDMENALKGFDQLPEHNVVSWTAIMAGYAQHGHTKEAFEFFDKMQQNGVVPNKITYVCILNAYEGRDNIEKAKQMHSCIKHIGFDSDVVVATAIVNMYGRCGSPRDARMVFDEMQERNLVTWNTMLSVYAQCGNRKQAFELFNMMMQKGEVLNKITFISMLSVCAGEEALFEGNWMHDQVVRRGYYLDVVVGNAIINMYSKCGQVEQARTVFERLSTRTVVSWSSMIAAYAQHGHGKEVLPMLQRMKREGVPPNLVTFKVILAACSHAGLVEDAHACLKSMSENFGLTPDVEHYDCVIDLLGRAGRLGEVENMMAGMPIQPTLIAWMMLLGSCSSQNDLQRGERIANQVFEMYPDSPAPYVILSNMYVDAGRDVDAEKLLSRMKSRGLLKQQDCSYIEIDGKVNEFSSASQTCPQAELVRAELHRIERLIGVTGYNIISKDKSGDFKGESKECYHTERLALAFGFLNTNPRDTILIIKSFPMCSQCHLFSKLMAEACNRHIIISDPCRVHRMQDGLCSCTD